MGGGRDWRLSLCAVCAAGAVGLSIPMAAAAGGTPDVDATRASMDMQVSAGWSVGLSPASVPVTFSGGCSGSFVDTSAPDAGLTGPPCGSLASSTTGTYMAVACTSGVVTGSWDLAEPSGTAAIANVTVIFAAGLGMVAAVSPTGGYQDDGSTGSLGGVAVMLPLPPTGCPFPGATDFGITMVLAAEYGTGA
jgi:hypothetical protein